MTVEGRRRENLRYGRDVWLAIATVFFGSGVFGILIAIVLSDVGVLGVGQNPGATAVAFALFLAAGVLSFLVSLNYHHEAVR